MGESTELIIQLLERLNQKVDAIDKSIAQLTRRVEALQSERPK